jgi:hypothetical protein
MNPDAAPTPPPAAHPGRFEGPAAFAEAVRWAWREAIARGARRIVFADEDFAAWPLGDTEALAASAAWMRLPQRRLVLLAPGPAYEAVERLHARFAQWRTPWSHAIDAHELPDDAALAAPCAVGSDAGPGLLVQSRESWAGHTFDGGRSAQAVRERIDALLQRSPIGWPAKRLGL